MTIIVVPDRNLVRSVSFCRIRIRIHPEPTDPDPIPIPVRPVRHKFGKNIAIHILKWTNSLLITFISPLRILKNLPILHLLLKFVKLSIFSCFSVGSDLALWYNVKCRAHNNPRWQNSSPSDARPPRSYRDPQNTRPRSSAPACWPPRSQTDSPRKCK